MTTGNNNEEANTDAEAELAARFLARADRILYAVDNAFIIRRRNHKPRLLPAFDKDELTIGKLLGTGGFGVVYEIDKFKLHHHVVENNIESKKDEVSNGGSKPAAATATTGGRETSTNGEMEESFTEHEQEAPSNGVAQVVSVEPTGECLDNDHIHYDVEQARGWMERQPTRDGSARYAIKHLKPNLNVLEQARGMVDLAVEAKFLRVVWHPNIIKIRGWTRCENIINKDFFIILDRLHSTLDEELKNWAARKKRYKGKMMGLIGSDKNGLNKLMLTRMTVAYDLASAFNYLHSNKLVYRDIKPENIGFDFRGNVKVFDFGLCKSLSRELRAKNFDYGYKLTGRAGSLPYMAPEVALMKTYDTKCDVFSFAILLWEILSLQPAFKEMKADVFVERVLMNKERLPVDKKWPPLTRLVIPEAWDDNPQLRPDMQRVAMLIRGDLNLMTTDETILRRTKHLNEQSMHSIRGQ